LLFYNIILEDILRKVENGIRLFFISLLFFLIIAVAYYSVYDDIRAIPSFIKGAMFGLMLINLFCSKIFPFWDVGEYIGSHKVEEIAMFTQMYKYQFSVICAAFSGLLLISFSILVFQLIGLFILIFAIWQMLEHKNWIVNNGVKK
jgi:hypothetical protein